ncbi:MAG: hypothetical protein NUV97_03135 [archaeon]|nr:hypothetical protein [archaeon]
MNKDYYIWGISLHKEKLKEIGEEVLPALEKEIRWRINLPMEGPLPDHLQDKVWNMMRYKILEIIQAQPEYEGLLKNMVYLQFIDPVVI